MQPLWPLPILLAMLAPPDPQRPEALAIGSPLAAVMHRLGTMDQESCEDWSTSIFKRHHRANLVVLKPSEIAKAYSRNKELLRRVTERTADAEQALEATLHELERVEEAALEKLAKDYERRLKRVLHNDPGQRRSRQATWERAWSAWKGLGSPAGQRGDLLFWLIRANRTIRPGGVLRPLPEIPRFHAEVALPLPEIGPSSESGAVASTGSREAAWQEWTHRLRRAIARRPTQPSLPPPEPPPTGLVSKLSPSTSAAMRPTAIGGEFGLPDSGTISLEPAFSRSGPFESTWQAAARGVWEFSPTTRDSDHLLPEVERLLAVQIPIPRLPPPVSVPTGVSGPGAPVSPLSEALVSTLPSADPEPPPAKEPPLPLQESVPLDSPATSRAARDSSEVAASVVRDVPVSVPKKASGRTSRRGSPSSPRDWLKLDELASRVAGYNLALHALEAELDKPRPWDSRNLAPLVARLRQLAVRRVDLNLFCELLPQSDRSLLPERESLDWLIAELGTRIFEARTYTASDAFRGTDVERRAELHGLDDLSRRLAAFATEQ